ncbi:MAG: sulfatase-like hydrolase/transferase [Gammaproteobacteria bacterium]|nr:sulfatase-like hydrolase/transferase [Gammaproteobacteria bacterium]
MNALLADSIWTLISSAAIISLIFSSLLVVKTLRDYSTAGPQIQQEIIAHYRLYAAWTVGRLTILAFLIALYWALAGVLAYLHLSILLDLPLTRGHAILAASAMLLGATTMQFLRNLLYCPAVIAASSHYRMSRFFTIWEWLNPGRLRKIDLALMTAALFLATGTFVYLVAQQDWATAVVILSANLAMTGIALASSWKRGAPPTNGNTGSSTQPNILMLGSDTLRADRLGLAGYKRSLTPTLDALADRGAWFENCYTPCGRTAPSLLSLLTGTWPHTHEVRDNFVSDAEAHITLPSLPGLLADQGYHTAAVSDWCGADLGKFNLGFQHQDLPSDSWNLRYLMRQGPKDLRLFLSLFLRNRLGKRIAPEIYYLGGVPLTDALGRDARHALSRLAQGNKPFLLNVFFSTTHPPFGSEYPYYTQYADPAYTGESKFVMARLTDPFDIIRRQGEPRKEFDLDQILDLYDGCVKRFDDEVSRILDHLEACGLADNTIVVIYSDHGMEFFEHGSWGQGNSVLGDHSARIPMIIHDPRKAGGHRIRSTVRTIDIAPTLLSLCGKPVPSTMEGVSLADCLDGSLPPTLPAYNESGIWLTDLPGMPRDHLRYPNLLQLLDIPDHGSGTFAIRKDYQDLIIEAKDRMIRLDRWKLTYQPTRTAALYSLYDLESDPGCRHDVIDQHPKIAQELKELLVEWLCQDKKRRWENEHVISR